MNEPTKQAKRYVERIVGHSCVKFVLV